MDQSWPEANVFNQFKQQVKNLIIPARDADQRRAWRVERILSTHILIRFGLLCWLLYLSARFLSAHITQIIYRVGPLYFSKKFSNSRSFTMIHGFENF
jgi:hypothetical protein